MGRERPAPDAEQVAEDEPAVRQLDHARRRARSERIRASPDSGRDHDRPAVREQLEVHSRDGAVGTRDERPAGRRRVSGAGPDRRRLGQASERGDGYEERDQRPALGTSSKSCRKLRAAAVAPPTSAIPQASRAVVAGMAETTTPCQKTGSETMLAAAATAPTTPAACTRRRPRR